MILSVPQTQTTGRVWADDDDSPSWDYPIMVKYYMRLRQYEYNKNSIIYVQ